jgi:hypothetical protein
MPLSRLISILLLKKYLQGKTRVFAEFSSVSANFFLIEVALAWIIFQYPHIKEDNQDFLRTEVLSSQVASLLVIILNPFSPDHSP